MTTLTITRNEMIISINNYFTGLFENITCGCANPIDLNASYRIFTNYNDKGGNLNLSGRFLAQCWSNYGTSELPTTLEAHPECEMHIVKMYKRIINL